MVALISLVKMETDNPYRVLKFFTKVIVGDKDECWPYTGCTDKKGYGLFYCAHRKSGKAHRFSYKLHYGEIDEALPVDHKECWTTACVNPYHLQQITNVENNDKSNSASAINKRKTHCIRGHPFTPENTIRWADGYRHCRACEIERNKRRYGSKK